MPMMMSGFMESMRTPKRSCFFVTLRQFRSTIFSERLKTRLLFGRGSRLSGVDAD